MRSLLSWLLAFFMVMFWIFRIIVTISAQYGNTFGGFIVFNNTVEIIMLFVTLLAFVLYIRRNVLGGLIYLFGYGYYFGSYIIANAVPALIEGEALEMEVMQNTIIAMLGIILGVILVLDILVEKARRKHYSDQKTDWFFDNKDYDRKLDDRADKNQYRTL